MRERLSGAIRVFCTAIALIALTQLPFWLMQARVAIQRPLLDLDYFVAILIMFRSRRLGLASLVLAWLVEINLDASLSYNFVGAADLVDAMRYADLVKLDRILSWKLIFIVAVVALCSWGLWRLVGRVRGPAVGVAVALIGFAAFGLDALNGSNHVLGIARDRFLVDANIAGSPSAVTLKSMKLALDSASQPMGRLTEPITYDHAVAWHDRHPHDSILVVLVESMGLPQAGPVRDWLAARLDTPEVERRWSVRRTTEHFRGSTVYGELRVLCGLQGHYSKLKPGEEQGCLPRRFLRSGEAALGLHGFNMRMFDRQQWWRDLGLSPQDLSAEASVPADVHCNDAFPGVCDGPVLRRATALADQPARLVYVVTLDTHLPLPTHAQALPTDLAPLCGSQGLSTNACQMVARLGVVLDGLRAGLVDMRNPPLVLVSGDHAPPFLDAETRTAFDPTHVQGFILEPR